LAPNGKPHVLFVYYSFTQQTRRVADAMAEVLRERGCDVTEAAIQFTDTHYGKKFSKRPMGWPIAKIVSMFPAQVRRKTGTIGIPPEASVGAYDLVVIGSPTWWLTTCMPIRTYLHDPASHKVLTGTPFAAFATSRRYYKNNLKTIRKLGQGNGGKFIDNIHFVSDGNQVMSMWSWLVFMRHDAEKDRSIGVHLPKPNLKVGFEEPAETFINAVADKVFTTSILPGSGR
jgi:menaquinone-dependent protoporphyrinogen IX oxidase